MKGDQWLWLGDLASHEVIVVHGPQRRVFSGLLAASASSAV